MHSILTLPGGNLGYRVWHKMWLATFSNWASTIWMLTTNYAVLLMALGRFSQALSEIQTAEQLDPLSHPAQLDR